MCSCTNTIDLQSADTSGCDDSYTTTATIPGTPKKVRSILGSLYLADVHAFGGNSGSPMFINLAGLRTGSLALGVDYRLLGVVSGYFFETADLQLQVATTLSGKANANSGISVVVPVDELRHLLDGPSLKQLRDAEAARIAK